MKRFGYKFLMCLFIALMVLSLLVAGCGDSDSDDADDGIDTSEAPQIPPVSTFVMDFDDFTDDAESAELAVFSPSGRKSVDAGTFVPADDTQTSYNWNHAAWKVGVWNVIIAVNLVVPVATFVESFNHDPVEQEDGSWVWSYDVTVAGVVYTAELHGEFVGQEVHWDMYITKEGYYEDFNWYSGVSNLPGTEGTWTLRKSPDDPTPWVGIEWHRNVEDGTGDIKYTNIVPDGDENGGYIFYGRTTDEPYDAFYDIYNKGEDRLTEIEWNRDTKEGRVKSPNFGDGDWQYWDSDHKDTEAPS